jgi:hypothetical protein
MAWAVVIGWTVPAGVQQVEWQLPSAGGALLQAASSMGPLSSPGLTSADAPVSAEVAGASLLIAVAASPLIAVAASLLIAVAASPRGAGSLLSCTAASCEPGIASTFAPQAHAAAAMPTAQRNALFLMASLLELQAGPPPNFDTARRLALPTVSASP